jgi:hypothetical protein
MLLTLARLSRPLLGKRAFARAAAPLRSTRRSFFLLAVFLALVVRQNLCAANVSVTNTNDSGAGSLRQAIISANPSDTVVFAAGVTGTITLTSGELLVGKNLAITGPGANVLSVSGNNASRVFHISPGNTVTISDLTVKNGNASGQGGGGIDNEHATVTVSTCSISNNSADYGAGLFNDGFASSATMTVRNCTVSGNTATSGYGGGGIYNHGQFGSGTLTLIDNTISGNSAAIGGGIYNNGIAGSAPLSLTNITLSASSGGGIYNDGTSSGSAPLSLYNTILNAGPSGANITNASGAVTSLGYNLSSDNGGGLLTAAGDLINTDPQLGPLQNNGGPTLTHALSLTSPAFNAGDPSFNPNAFNPPLVNDQRGPGFVRVANGRVDIGAFEYPQTVTNTNDSGTGSLRQALIEASPGTTIGFVSGLTGTITLTGGELLVNKNVVIAGPGANILSVSGNNASSVFHISNGQTVTISGLTIRNGHGTWGGGIQNERSTVTVTNSTLNNNSATYGGGIYNGSAGTNLTDPSTLTVSYCTLSNNSAIYGGAILNDGIQSLAFVRTTVTNSTLNNNSATYGGGIYNNGQDALVRGSGFRTAALTVTNSTLSNNSASFGGGGVFNNGSSGNGGSGSASATLNYVTLTGSTGGGIYNFGDSGTAEFFLYTTLLNAGPSGSNITNSSGVVTSSGYNLSSDNGSGLLGPSDLINTDPKLGPLQDNGGPTFTHALLSGSPAIDQAPFDRQGDQRGYPRIGYGDIGAFEFQSLRIISITRSGSSIVVAFYGVTPETYRLERKLNLTDPTWQSIPGVNDVTVGGGSSGVKSITDPNGISLGKAFYRIRVLP